MKGQPSQDAAEIIEVDTPPTARAPEIKVTELPTDKMSLVELSSNTDTESCEAYISRTVELLASVEPVTLGLNNELSAETKVSTSDPLAITPGLNEWFPKVSPVLYSWASLMLKSPQQELLPRNKICWLTLVRKNKPFRYLIRLLNKGKRRKEQQ